MYACAGIAEANVKTKPIKATLNFMGGTSLLELITSSDVPAKMRSKPLISDRRSVQVTRECELLRQ